MATISIQQAIDTAKKDPTSEFAKKLRSAIESGQLDQAAQKQGVDLSRFGRPAPQQSFLKETVQDIKEIGTQGGQALERRADKVGEIKQSNASPASKVLQTFGQGAGAASDVIGQAVIGVGKVVLPQKAEQKIADSFEAGVTKALDTTTAQNLIQGYSEIKQKYPNAARNFEAGANILGLFADLAGIGVAGKTVKPIGSTVRQGAEVGTQAAGKTGQLATKGVAEVQGALTGTSGETIETAFRAVKAGGKQLEAYTNALRKQTTPEQLVDIARSAVDVVSSEKSAGYSEMLKSIGQSAVDASNVETQVINTLSKLGVKVTKDGLDFSASKFRTVPQAQNKLTELFNEVQRASQAKTLIEVDTARQALKNLLLAGDDASARTANLAITDAVNAVREVGMKVPGYKEALIKFGDDAEFLTELQRSLSAGDQATIDTAYRKLATTLKTNNEQRLKLVNELDERTGGALLSAIAGQQLSEELPRGIFRQIAAGMAGGAVLTGGLSTSILPALVFASPRVTGEVVRALGLSAVKANKMLEGINAARKLLVK